MDAREKEIDRKQHDGHTVVGLFKDVPDARRAIDRLKAAGFDDDKIGVAMRDRAQQEEIRSDTGTKAAQGAASGAVGGGIVGGVLGLLAGVGALAIPGVGPVIAGGVLASTLAGAGIGATAGGIGGALIGMGLREDEAKHFERALEGGGVLVAVESRDRGVEARQILMDAGADLGPGQDLAAGRSTASDAEMLDGDVGGRRGSLATEVESSYVEGASMSSAAHMQDFDEDRPLDHDRMRGGSSSDGDRVGDEPLMENESWRGNERRYHNDPGYSGPERRLAYR
jgi:hypothetical protein